MHLRAFVLGQLTRIPREGDGSGDDEGAGDGTDPGDGGGGDGGGGDGGQKTFTQEEVNKIVGQRQKALRAEHEKLAANYQEILKQKNLTETQRQKLEADLESVQSQLRTKEQQVAHEAKKAAEAHKRELEKAVNERQRFQTLFEQSTVERAIVDAAVQHEAYSPTQLVSLLRDRVKVVEEVNDRGEVTGRLVPLAEVEQADPTTGEIVKVRKTPAELIAEMKEDAPTYGNLFKANVAQGIGQGKIPAGGKLDVTKMSDEDYFRNREAIHQQLGIRKGRNF